MSSYRKVVDLLLNLRKSLKFSVLRKLLKSTPNMTSLCQAFHSLIFLHLQSRLETPYLQKYPILGTRSTGLMITSNLTEISSSAHCLIFKQTGALLLLQHHSQFYFSLSSAAKATNKLISLSEEKKVNKKNAPLTSLKPQIRS